MLGRYMVEVILILLCGMGLHAMEVERTGGPEAFVRFDQVGAPAQFVYQHQSRRG